MLPVPLQRPPGGEAVALFRENYLAVARRGTDPIDYPYSFIAPSNTGVPSGFDLDNDGTTDLAKTFKAKNGKDVSFQARVRLESDPAAASGYSPPAKLD